MDTKPQNHLTKKGPVEVVAAVATPPKVQDLNIKSQSGRAGKADFEVGIGTPIANSLSERRKVLKPEGFRQLSLSSFSFLCCYHKQVLGKSSVCQKEKKKP